MFRNALRRAVKPQPLFISLARAYHNTHELSIFNDDSGTGDRATAAIFHDDKSVGRKRFARTKGRPGPKRGDVAT